MATQKQVFTEITESIDRCNHTLPGLIQFLKNGFKKLENASGGGGGGSEVSWTQIQASGTKIAEIEIDGDKTSVYAPTGATPTISVNAEDVAYSNTVSGLTATNVQGAIDEVKSLIPGASGSVSVTADGVKTNSQLLNELHALVDPTKLTEKSTLILESANVMYFFHAYSFNMLNSIFTFGNAVYGISNYGVVNGYILRASGSTAGGNDSSGTYNDQSASVLGAGSTFTIQY